MSYTRTHPRWAPGVAGGTIVSAVALNEMDDGISTVADQADNLQSQVDTTSRELSDLSATVAQIQDGIQQGLPATGGTGGAVASVAGRTGIVILTKADVNLSNADNTADVDKPVSTAQQAALNLKAPIASPTFTGTVSGVTKTMVGLGNVDNTSDVNKPVSTAQANALALKANLASPTFTGTVNGITKTMVGLGNVDNTSDVTKFNNYNVFPTIYYTGSAWPTRTVPTGYTGPVVWNSEIYPNVAAPSGGLVNDRWARKQTS